MAYIANTAFEPKVTNGVYNGLQNVAGKFGSFSGDTFTGAICSAGFLVKKSKLIPCEGYENLTNPILNGNTWYFVADTDGSAVAGQGGDHTGIYACNTYDVNKVVSADGTMKYNLGAQTLGLALPADEIGDFSELIVGEQYKFGAGNFASTPTVGQYCAISNGLWGASSASAPDPSTDAGDVYCRVLRAEAFNEGTNLAGTGYVVEILRA